MGRKRRSFMSDQLKNELAKDLGFYETVQREGWGGIKAKDAGNMVKRAIQLAEQAAAKQHIQQQQPAAEAHRPSGQTYMAQATPDPYKPQSYTYRPQQPARGSGSSYVPGYMQTPPSGQQSFEPRP
ncbi:hypothetical protein GCM10010911_67990 [Paenibacillus nasutitermitis]|uniref:Small, acid-soluble spore protein, alpha/beta type n=1 Tax=Paenibacillus nasutitermitis TaxID=1652958 RepID=A0A917E3A6_9BACL|nr:hypothetical protein GCM10010911_67990 [Paenibacillus nasutitermitis]